MSIHVPFFVEDLDSRQPMKKPFDFFFDEDLLREKIASGTTADIYKWNYNDGFVLKLFHADIPIAMIEYEASLACLVYAAGLGPKMWQIYYLTTEDGYGGKLAGRAGIIYDVVAGDSLAKLLRQNPRQVVSLAQHFANLHADIHTHNGKDFPSQREHLQHKIQAAPRLSDKVKAKCLRVLSQLPDDDRICHGDYHPENVLLKSSPADSASAVVSAIDWIDATRGSAVADVARTMLVLKMASATLAQSGLKGFAASQVVKRFADAYLQRYRELRPAPQADINKWLMPLAGARLTERRPPDEEDRLLAMVEAGV
jgi:Ser/Thr protein kinase RdoA (MazF antagonist)